MFFHLAGGKSALNELLEHECQQLSKVLLDLFLFFFFSKSKEKRLFSVCPFKLIMNTSNAATFGHCFKSIDIVFYI